MTSVSLLTHGERTRINTVQKNLGIQPNRLAHVRQVIDNFFKLCREKKGAFYNAITPENRRFEDRQAYLERIQWLCDSLKDLNINQRTSLEAGIRLHDIGCTLTSGGDHPEQGYKLLQGKSGNQIFRKLRLSSTTDFEWISSIVRYHGLFTDIGFLYPPEIINKFSLAERKALVIMSGLDSTAKPFDKGFHSMLFSRLLTRYRRFLEEGGYLGPEEKLQQLFGPINYVWLKDDDLTILGKAIDTEGLKGERGFNLILGQTYFWCWPLLKDLVTPDISFSTTYFTPFKSDYASHFARFLLLIAQLIEKLEPSSEIIVDTAFNYYNFENRPPFLSILREIFESTKTQIKQVGKTQFVCQKLRFQVEKQGDSQKILISASE